MDKDDEKIRCPMKDCKQKIEPETCGFANTFYRFSGIIDNNDGKGK